MKHRRHWRCREREATLRRLITGYLVEISRLKNALEHEQKLRKSVERERDWMETQWRREQG